MTTPTFDTIEAQASYGIGLQVGQQPVSYTHLTLPTTSRV